MKFDFARCDNSGGTPLNTTTDELPVVVPDWGRDYDGNSEVTSIAENAYYIEKAKFYRYNCTDLYLF